MYMFITVIPNSETSIAREEKDMSSLSIVSKIPLLCVFSVYLSSQDETRTFMTILYLRFRDPKDDRIGDDFVYEVLSVLIDDYDKIGLLSFCGELKDRQMEGR